MSRTPAKFRRMRPILFGKQKCTVAFAPWSMNGSGRGLTRMGVNRHPPGTSSELHGPFRPYWSTRRNTKRALNSPQDQQFRNYSSANHTRFLTNGTTSSWRQPRKQVDTSLPLWRATGRQACASPALSGAVAIFWLADHAGEHQSLVSAGVCTSVRRARTAAQLIDLAAERLLKWRFDGPCWQNDANRKHFTMRVATASLGLSLTASKNFLLECAQHPACTNFGPPTFSLRDIAVGLQNSLELSQKLLRPFASAPQAEVKDYSASRPAILPKICLMILPPSIV